MILDAIMSIELVCVLLIVVSLVLLEIAKRRFHIDPYLSSALYEFGYMILAISVIVILMGGLLYAWLR